MAFHRLEPERGSLHGHWSKDLAPALEIESGDTVQFRTLDADWNLERPSGPGESKRQFEPRESGHALTGPVAIKGAEPGMMLEIRIEEIRLDTWGQSGGGGTMWDLNKALHVAGGERHHHLWDLDPDALIGTNQHSQKLKLRPFMGVMGMPMDEPGNHATWPPRVTGGNLDCKELIAGTTLYLPIQVPGGNFSVGDGHAVQGDGEVSGVAIECPMACVTLTFTLREYPKLTTPRARTEAGWLCFGLHRNLDEAALIATNDMLDLMSELYDMDRKDALNHASLVVDLRITQIVNGTKGVHAVLPDGAIKP